jgi:signal transduction histidine kinase
VLQKVNRWLDVVVSNPEDARRRKLLNILLLGVFFIVILAMLATTFDYDITTPQIFMEEVVPVYVGGLVVLVGGAVTFLINRYKSGRVASSIFLLLYIVAIAFSDDPIQVTEGRGVSLFAVPILMASFLLRPWASFPMAVLNGVVITAISMLVLQTTPPWSSLIALFSIALASWLASDSLERALEEVRIINRELDQRVIARTRDLAEALSKNQAILEGIADGVIVFDNTGKAIVANPAIGNLLLRPPEEILNNPIEALFDGNVADTDKQVIAGLLRDTTSHHPSLKVQWGPKTLSVSFAPVRTDPDSLVGTVAVFRDFTKEAEVDRMKSAIVSMVSHDLRTPLNAIMGYAEMILENVYGPLTEKQTTTMNRIVANSKRLLSLVNDLLDQAQIEAGKLTLKVIPFAPQDLAEGIQSVMGVLAQTKNLELTTQIAADMPATLYGDPQRLHQILVNLMGNSMKFTEKGGVYLRIYRRDAEHWAMDVTDTGPGIPPDKLGNLFQRFYQVDSSATKKHQGVGLGLSIVKQLTMLMGGSVGVTSEVGKGSVFTVVLPFAAAPAQGAKA